MLRAVMLLVLLGAVGEGAPLKPHPEVACHSGRTVQLEVRAANITVEGVVTYQTRAYHYNGVAMVPGPTIVMKAGSRCRIRLVNNLDAEKCSGFKKSYHCADTTSLHTHGLHVSPDEDDVKLSIEPRGGSHLYSYTIPSDHLMGTHWYHAHHAGSTSVQVTGGMAGGLIMEPADDYRLPYDLSWLYREKSIPPLVLTAVLLGGEPAHHNEHMLVSMQAIVAQFPDSNLPLLPRWHSEHAGKKFYVVNGQYDPTVTIRAERATLLRFVHATGLNYLTLTVDEPDCEMTLVARDGVFQYTPYLKPRAITMFGGSRADVAILCKRSTAGRVVNVRAANDVAYVPSKMNSFVQASVFKIRVTSPFGSRPLPQREAPLPDYLRSLMNVDDVQEGGEETKMTKVTFAHHDGPSMMNMKQFAGFGSPPLEVFCLGKTYQFTIAGPGPLMPDGPQLSMKMAHPYHHHVNHFQVVNSVGDREGHVVRRGEWRDVVPNWNVTIRVRPMRFTGKALAHCHALQHSDTGMKGYYLLKHCPTPPPATPSPKGTCPSTCYGRSCDGWAGYGLSCQVLETRYGCDCGGCSKCSALPQCRATCFRRTCDDWARRGFACRTILRWCNCDGCSMCRGRRSSNAAAFEESGESALSASVIAGISCGAVFVVAAVVAVVVYRKKARTPAPAPPANTEPLVDQDI